MLQSILLADAKASGDRSLVAAMYRVHLIQQFVRTLSGLCQQCANTLNRLFDIGDRIRVTEPDKPFAVHAE
jgi:hypothetical protein